jgi:hypothetical protein
MHQFARIVLMAGAVLLAACSSAPSTARGGAGTVESVTQVDRDAARMGNTPSMSGSPGSHAPLRNAYEVTVRMDDGSRRKLTQEAVAFKAGDRVRVTADGKLAP